MLPADPDRPAQTVRRRSIRPPGPGHRPRSGPATRRRPAARPAGASRSCRSRSSSSPSWPAPRSSCRATRSGGGRRPNPGTPASEQAAFQPFWDTYHTITDRYAGGAVDRETAHPGRDPGDDRVARRPVSPSYLTSDEYRQSLQGISGQFEGIGAEIATQAADGTQGCTPLGPACHLVVTEPIEGRRPRRPGCQAGDLVAGDRRRHRSTG